MTTTAPSTDAPRLTDGDTLREDVARAIAEEWGHARAKVTMNPGTPFVVPFHEMTTAAIAAAEPHLRARHRAEVFAELIRDYQHYSDIANEHGEAARSIGWHRVLIDLRQRQEVEADATRPVEGRADR